MVALAVFSLGAGLAPKASADALRILDDDWEAAQARVDLIQQAQATLDVAYFAISDDNLALAYLALLRDASRRGVRVRLIVDAMYNDIPAGVQTCLTRQGVRIREFHPLSPCRPLWINRRMHDKVLIADGCEMIVGSRNLDHRNFGLSCDDNFVDRDAYVRGEAVAQANCYFQRLWTSKELRPTDASPEKPDEVDDCEPMRSVIKRYYAGRLGADQALDEARFELLGGHDVHVSEFDGWAAGASDLSRVHFLSDDRGRKRRPDAIFEQILTVIENAQHSIILESPYLVVSSHLDKALRQAQSRGVRVVILTNSLASTDETIVYAGYSNQKKRLLARNIELWEFAGCDHLHAKSALIDGCISIIGSYNFDHRSEHLNTETGVVTCDPQVAAALVDSLAEHFGNAWRIGPDGKPVNSADRHPGADGAKVWRLRGARLIASLIKPQL